MDNQLVALFELKRQTFLLGYIQSPDKIDDAHAFAVQNRVAPVFHENISRETHGGDPFADVYAVKEDFIIEVLRYVDKRWLEKDFDALGFYKLEDKFGGYKANRVELKHALEYIRMTGRFDSAFWTAVESDAPAEATSLDSEFSPKDVYFD